MMMECPLLGVSRGGVGDIGTVELLILQQLPPESSMEYSRGGPLVPPLPPQIIPIELCPLELPQRDLAMCMSPVYDLDPVEVLTLIPISQSKSYDPRRDPQAKLESFLRSWSGLNTIACWASITSICMIGTGPTRSGCKAL